MRTIRRGPFRAILFGVLLVSLLAGAGAGAVSAETPGEGPVHLVQLDGPLGPVNGSFLLERLRAAPGEGAQLVVVTINSSASFGFDAGRLVDATRASAVPVAVWVGGRGAAARAGAAELVAAADFVARFPGAVIDPEVAVDLEAGAVGDVVVGLDGVTLKGVTLDTAISVTDPGGTPRRQPAVVTRFFRPPFLDRVLHAVGSPNLAAFLLIAGLSAAAFEWFTAGIGLAALTGVFCLTLSFYGFANAPTRWFGVALIALGVLALCVDVQDLAVGSWTAGGTVLVAAGILLSFLGAPPGFRPTPWVTILVVALTLLFWVVAMRVMVRTRYSTPQVRRGRLTGEWGTAVTGLAPRGLVEVRGARWPAVTSGPRLHPGDPVHVDGADGLELLVRLRDE